MDKRFPMFLILSALILVGYLWFQSTFMPKQPGVDEQAQEEPDDKDKDKEKKNDVKPEEKPVLAPVQAQDTSQQWPTLGSLDADSPFRFAATFNSRGGTIERIEFNERKASGRYLYRDLQDKFGYMGSFAPSTASGDKGCQVNVVVDGTPAHKAGLQAGDVIVKIADEEIQNSTDYADAIEYTRPGDTIVVEVRRGQEKKTFDVELRHRPLSVVRPDPKDEFDVELQDPLSMVLSIGTLDNGKFKEIAPLMATDNWQMKLIDSKEQPAVEFRYRLEAEKDQADEKSEPSLALEVIKRYRLVPTPEEERSNSTFKSYHLEFEIEIVNLGATPQELAYQLAGPTGLPTEGWWFVNKIHPNKIIGGAGARDVVWRSSDSGLKLWGASEIFSNTLDAEEARADKDRKKEAKYVGKNRLFTPQSDKEDRTLRYLGGDSQYFSVMLLPGEEESDYLFHEGKASLADPARTSEVDEKTSRKSDTTFRVISSKITIQPGASESQKFILFAGPKEPDLLEQYGLKDLTEYGWYGFISKPLTGILHFFYGIVRNYGIAIIMLTVLVRACMMPISRKAARNAQMMQLLQPEMKKIAEKYKNDMQKRGEEQRALFAKYKYNPFGGCLLMFLQLPIFLGLYRGLSVDIALRDQPLIPGISWASNLAAPDQLFYWADKIPIAFLTSESSGWLGPYFNILPLITVALFLVQQKLFTPPAQDDQARMTQRMMTFMTLFIGLMFFKVPSGLCIYFITSSIWGVAERKLLPKPKLSERVTSLAEQGGGKPAAASNSAKSAKSKTSDNGAARKARANQRRKQQQKKKR